jgi:3-methyladenine DNA glycosylase/8-oxoguanine DNA glycosylase
MRVHDAVIGLRVDSVGTRRVLVSVYSDRPLRDDERDHILRRVTSSYGLNDDLSSLNAQLAIKGEGLGVDRVRGMRISCPESVFEIAIISLLLQNTTIARTTQMMRSLLSSYGHRVRFDGVSLRAFFSPAEIASVEEARLRAESRLGYRAKYLPEFAKHFRSDGNVGTPDSKAHLVQDLELIRGIGPYSAAVIASAALRDPRAVPLDVWNVQILHDALLGSPGRDRDAVLDALTSRFQGLEGLVSLYIIESRFLASPIDPLFVSVAEARRVTARRIETAFA